MTGRSETKHIDLSGAAPGTELLLFGGIYSNLQALEAVRAFAKTRGIPPEHTLCTGDTVAYCAHPSESIAFVRDWGIHAIAGNVEMNIRDGLEDCGCNFDDNSRCDIFSRIWYPFAQQNSSAEAVAYMQTLPEYLEVRFGESRLTVVHGNYGETSGYVWRSSDWDECKAPAFAKTGSDVVIAGHCGLPFAHEHNGKLWLNPGVIGMPANDGTPRTWCATLRLGADGTLDYDFHALDYDYKAARRQMLAHPLPKSYALTVDNGLWDNTEIMPAREADLTGIPLDAQALKAEAKSPPNNPPTKQPNNRPPVEKQYFDPKDLKRFGRISEHQPEMGKQFFDWYENATYGDTALTQREKALIALAVSHTIRCPYCVDAFTTNCLESGADEEAMMEAVHVAAAIQAGSTLISSVQMIKQAEKLGM